MPMQVEGLQSRPKWPTVSNGPWNNVLGKASPRPYWSLSRINKLLYKPEKSFPEKGRFSPDFLFEGKEFSFFYTYIRKNASTAFKKLFQEVYPGVCPGDLPSINCMGEYAQVNGLQPDEIDQRFAIKLFVYRDPIDRVFSVYKNKLIQVNRAADILKQVEKVVRRDPGLLTFD